MKDSEAVTLYHQAVSVTPTQPTEFAADMWCEVLRDLRYEDARQALLTLVRRSTFASPSEIRDEVRKLRAKRIADHGDPVPPAGLTAEEDLAWRRDALRRIGDGETVNHNRGRLKPRTITPLGRRMDQP